MTTSWRMTLGSLALLLVALLPTGEAVQRATPAADTTSLDHGLPGQGLEPPPYLADRKHAMDEQYSYMKTIMTHREMAQEYQRYMQANPGAIRIGDTFFDQIDANGDGNIDEAESRAWTQGAAVKPSVYDLHLLNAFDLDDNSLLDRREFQLIPAWMFVLADHPNVQTVVDQIEAGNVTLAQTRTMIQKIIKPMLTELKGYQEVMRAPPADTTVATADGEGENPNPTYETPPPPLATATAFMETGASVSSRSRSEKDDFDEDDEEGERAAAMAAAAVASSYDADADADSTSASASASEAAPATASESPRFAQAARVTGWGASALSKVKSVGSAIASKAKSLGGKLGGLAKAAGLVKDGPADPNEAALRIHNEESPKATYEEIFKKGCDKDAISSMSPDQYQKKFGKGGECNRGKSQLGIPSKTDEVCVLCQYILQRVDREIFERYQSSQDDFVEDQGADSIRHREIADVHKKIRDSRNGRTMIRLALEDTLYDLCDATHMPELFGGYCSNLWIAKDFIKESLFFAFDPTTICVESRICSCFSYASTTTAVHLPHYSRIFNEAMSIPSGTVGASCGFMGGPFARKLSTMMQMGCMMTGKVPKCV